MTNLDHLTEMGKWHVVQALVEYMDHHTLDDSTIATLKSLCDQLEPPLRVGDMVRVMAPDSSFEGMIGEVKSVNPIRLDISVVEDERIDTGPFEPNELELVKASVHDEEDEEERLERQAQEHLEAAARHRDDPMF